jgi:type IV secretory pathway VirB2 component (pilin)
VRRAVAILIVLVAFSAAFYIHRRTHLESCGLGYDRPVCSVRSSWQDPVAVVIVVAGLTAAVGTMVVHRDRTFANPSY